MKTKIRIEVDENNLTLADRLASAWGETRARILQSSVARGLAQMAQALSKQRERDFMDAEIDAKAAYEKWQRTGSAEDKADADKKIADFNVKKSLHHS